MSEDAMRSVNGSVTEFLRDAVGGINGFVLDGSQEVRSSQAQLDLMTEIITLGSRIEISGELQYANHEQAVLGSARITNLDSKQTTSLPAPVCLGKPGMLSGATSTKTASLAPPSARTGESERSKRLRNSTNGDAFEQNVTEIDSTPLHPGSYFHSMLGQKDGRRAELVRNNAARNIGSAFDRLHRIQAILAYLHIMKYRVPGISEFLEEAKHTYVQALAQFAASDYTGAKEFAEASASLSRVVEIVMARTLRSDNSLPSLVPPPPGHPDASPEPEHVEENLAQAETVLSRIHWVLENGTMPSEERAQVRKIASWGDAFYKQARRTYRDAVLEDAAEFAQAALAGANSAEHVCRKWYGSTPLHP
jgi:hypothetical protein